MKDESTMAQTANDISVIICAYTEARWDDLVAAVNSVRQQTLPAAEIIVVIDHNPQLLERVQDHISDVIAVENVEVRGLSGARNSGIAVARSYIIAFLDDDAVATANWLRSLHGGFNSQQILGVGGRIMPLWAESEPAWFPEEFHWVVGCTYRGIPQTAATIRNPIGANMSFRREVFDGISGFRSDVGRIGMLPLGCEETELCIRVRQHWPESRFLYLPQASVFHRVPVSRTSWRYFCSRCYSEGLSKSVVTCYVGPKDGLSSEYSYMFRTLPKGVVDNLLAAFFHRDRTRLATAGAIVVGLAITGAGYFIGSISLWITRSKKKLSLHKLHRSAMSEPPRLHSEVER